MTPGSEAVRRLFPALESYVWLNAAASSPLPSPVGAAIAGFLEETMAKGDLGFPSWLRFKETVRARMARFLGAQAREVAFTPSTSFGFHIIAQMLKARGQTEVLSLETEFPSTTLPLLNAGLTVRGVRVRPDGSYPLEDIARALRPTTKAVAVSLVQFSSGYRVDVQGLSALCRQKGLTLALNGAQALGQVPVDVGALGAAFLCGTSHKWLMAGYGTGLLWVRQDWLEAVPPVVGSWVSVPQEVLWQTFGNARRVDDADGFTVQGGDFRRDAAALEVGPANLAGLYGLDAALGLLESLGVGAIQAHTLSLQQRLRAGLRARGFVPNAPDDASVGSGICTVPVAGEPLDAVRALLGQGIVTTPRGGGLRLSTHLFNTPGDVDAVLEALGPAGVRPHTT